MSDPSVDHSVGTVGLQSTNIWRAVYIAVRSTIGAIALIAIFDGQFLLSSGLHWTIATWKAAIDVVFALLPWNIDGVFRPAVAFLIVTVGTILTEYVLNLDSDERAWRVQNRVLIVLLAIGFTVYASIAGPEEIASGNPVGLSVSGLLLGFAVSHRLVLWLAIFTGAVVGINEIALLIEGAVPAPPAN